MRESAGGSVARGAIVFALAAPFTYGLERALEVATGHPSDPRTVLYSLHTAYYWRVAVALWWGVVVAIFWIVLFSRTDDRRFVALARLAAIMLAIGYFTLAFALP